MTEPRQVSLENPHGEAGESFRSSPIPQKTLNNWTTAKELSLSNYIGETLFIAIYTHLAP